MILYLDDPVHGNCRLGKNSLDILAAHLGLIREAALNQVALAIRGDLARDVERSACNDGLGLIESISSRAGHRGRVNVRRVQQLCRFVSRNAHFQESECKFS
jgi:hypothetical protein